MGCNCHHNSHHYLALLLTPHNTCSHAQNSRTSLPFQTTMPVFSKIYIFAPAQQIHRGLWTVKEFQVLYAEIADTSRFLWKMPFRLKNEPGVTSCRSSCQLLTKTDSGANDVVVNVVDVAWLAVTTSKSRLCAFGDVFAQTPVEWNHPADHNGVWSPRK